MIISKRGSPIVTVEDWFRLAPPKGGHRHWVPGRSAMELARAWCGTGSPAVPAAIAETLQSVPELGQVEVLSLEPECLLPFDELPGEPRNADLAGLVRSALGLTALAVEAKADETFGELVQSELDSAARKIGADGLTNMVARIQHLAKTLLPPPVEGGTPLGELRYQLLTATAGLMALAVRSKAAAALLIIHEFQTWRTDASKHKANRQDFERFLSRLAGAPPASMLAVAFAGPFTLPGYKTIPLFVGRAASVVDEWRLTTA